MSEEKNIVLKEFEIASVDEAKIKKLNETIKDLTIKGYELKIKIEGKESDLKNIAGLDPDQIKTIKQKQELPNDVIINFLNSLGSLNESGFKERF